MAYADQQMSGNRVAAIIIVALLHLGLGYVLVTGLAYEAVKQIAERVTTVDVEEPEPEPEEEPPPPEDIPETAPPPVVIPPPPFQRPTENTLRDTTPDPKPRDTTPARTATKKTCADGRVVDENVSCGPETKKCPGGETIAINATCPPAGVPPKDPTPKGNPSRWVTTNDYPSRSLREEEEGTTSVSLTISPDGKVSGCRVTSSSGSSRLDEAACSNLQRRARFNPATDRQGQPTTGSYSYAVRWQIPE